MFQYGIIFYNSKLRKKYGIIKKRSTKIQLAINLKMTKVIAVMIWYQMLNLMIIVILSKHY